jgi:hypothetical protein
MAVIELTRGYVALVDDEDAEWLRRFSWSAEVQKPRRDGHRRVYARRAEWDGKRQRYISMHRDIMGRPVGVQVDHINGDGLDNRRVNLRLATHAQNQFNQRSTRGTSRYKGVCWDARSSIWRAQIWTPGRRSITLGYFDDELAAARAYDQAAIAARGAYAAINGV